MVFVEFTTKTNCIRDKRYFIGRSVEDVLEDTNGGTRFQTDRFASHAIVSESEIRELKLPNVDLGKMVIVNGGTSFPL